jgi:hypothetical membrane protein
MPNVKKVAATCGIIAPIFAFMCILAAVASWSPFSWTENALSDLGVQPGATAVVFNVGLVVCGVLCLVFSAGLFRLVGKRLMGKIGVFLFVLACVFLVAIGIFNENFSPTHYNVSVGFFVSLPISLLVLVAGLWLVGERKLSVFSFAVGLAAATPWILQFTVHYVPNVAIPEFASSLAGAVWAVVLSVRILKASSSKA